MAIFNKPPNMLDEYLFKGIEYLYNKFTGKQGTGLVDALYREYWESEIDYPDNINGKTMSLFNGKAKNIINTFKEKYGIDALPERYGEVDIAHPANKKEYCDLGGYSFMKVTAVSEHAEELPIERAYFQGGDGSIKTLESLEIAVNDKPHFTNRIIETKDDKGNVFFKSWSYWVILTAYFMDDEGSIAIDFKENRKAFVIRRGPWKHPGVVSERVKGNHSLKLKPARKVEFEDISKFIDREFMKRR